jgi:hypothetical protein
MTPSIGPGFWPWSFNACWTRFTSSLPAAVPLARDEDMPEVEVSEEELMPDEPVEDDIPEALDWLPLRPLRLPPSVPWEPCDKP